MRFDVQNMTCDHCVRTITRAIHTIDAEAEVKVDLAAGSVEVTGLVTAAEAIAAMAEEGYPARQRDVERNGPREAAASHNAAAS